MRIGIDIDDTAYSTIDSLLKYADKFEKENFGKQIEKNKIGNIKDGYYLKSLYNWEECTEQSFFSKYYKDILNESIKNNDVSSVINKLKEAGNEIIFITARLTNIPNCDSINITKQAFERDNIPYDKLIFDARDKKEFCLINKIDVYIEDSVDICEQIKNIGIKTLLMTTKINQYVKVDDIQRVSNWNEIYDIISKMN